MPTREDKCANAILMCLHPTDLLTNYDKLYYTYVKIVVNLWILYVLKFSCPRLIFDQHVFVFYLQTHGDLTTKTAQVLTYANQSLLMI